MRRRVVVAAVLAATGCATGPSWVHARQFVCETPPCAQVLSGVGWASGEVEVANGTSLQPPGVAWIPPSLRRGTAEATARNALADVVRQKVRGDAPPAFRALVDRALVGTEVVDHWISRDNTEYALAVLTRASMQQALAVRTDLTADDRAALSALIDALFSRQDAHP